MSLSESLEKVKYILSSVTKKITNGAKRRETAAEIAKALDGDVMYEDERKIAEFTRLGGF